MDFIDFMDVHSGHASVESGEFEWKKLTFSDVCFKTLGYVYLYLHILCLVVASVSHFSSLIVNRHHLRSSLKNLSFTISSNEKVAIVGCSSNISIVQKICMCLLHSAIACLLQFNLCFFRTRTVQAN